MKKRRLTALLVLACCLPPLLTMCAKTPVMAGATSETTNGKILGTVVRSDASPASGARVYLVDDEKWLANVLDGKPVVTDSAVADHGGRFSLAVPLNHASNIHVDNNDEGLFVRDIAAGLDTGATSRDFMLKPFGAVSGTIAAESGTPLECALGGSMYRASLSPGSGFSLDRVAEGSFDILAKVNGAAQGWVLCTTVRPASGALSAFGNIPAQTSSLLVDDFSGGGWQSGLGRLIGGGWWYTVTDSAGGGSSSVAMADDSGPGVYAGKSRHVSYVIGAGATYPYVIMGVYLGNKDSAYIPATTGFGALSFMIRGTGTVTVSFVNFLTDPAEKKRNVSFDRTIPVPAQWSRVEIPVDSLRVTADNQSGMLGKTWGQFNHSLQIITFMASGLQTAIGDSVDLWLDDISLKGVTLQDFVF
jgi:hypothetical protein